MKNIHKIEPNELLDYIDRQMKIKNKKQFEVLRDLSIDSSYIGKLRHKLGRQLRVGNSSLATRIAYCSMIISGKLSVKDVVEVTGYTDTSIRNWLKDYKEYGSSMIDRAISFRH